MKRYDLIEYPACGTYDTMMDERPDGDWCSFEEVQALLRAVAEEARKLRHAEGCHSFVYPNTNATTPHAPRFVVGRLDESKCNCPRGKVLAMLEVE